MQIDPSLMELGARLGVILATPSTLIGLLRSVAYAWKSESITKNAKSIQILGKELYKRILDMSKHLQGMGRSLNGAVDNYNRTIGSFERRVISSARKFHELGVSPDNSVTPVFDSIDTQTRNIQNIHLDQDEVTID